MGWWCSDTATLYFDNCRIPAENLMGQENRGFIAIMKNFNLERVGLIAHALGMSKLCLKESIHYAQERQTFGKPLIQHQVIRHKIADMSAKIDAVEAYLNQICWLVNESEMPSAEISKGKFLATKTLEFCASEAMQIFGGAAYLRGNLVERTYREVKVMAIGGQSDGYRWRLRRNHARFGSAADGIITENGETTMGEVRAQTRRQRVEEKEQAIIAAARKVFQKQGFEKAKISEIAKLVGVAEGTVYLYFENKKALLFAVAAEFYERLTDDAAEGIKGLQETSERLKFLARHHFERVSQEWQMLALAMMPAKVSDEYRQTEEYQLNRTYVAVFDQVIRDGINRGEIRTDVPLSVMRDVFYGGLEYGARTMRLHPQTTKMDEIVANFMLVFSGGMFSDSAELEKRNPSDEVDTMVARLEKVMVKLEGFV